MRTHNREMSRPTKATNDPVIMAGMATMGAAGLAWSVLYVVETIKTINLNKFMVSTYCTTGTHWCSPEYTSRLTASNGLLMNLTWAFIMIGLVFLAIFAFGVLNVIAWITERHASRYARAH